MATRVWSVTAERDIMAAVVFIFTIETAGYGQYVNENIFTMKKLNRSVLTYNSKYCGKRQIREHLVVRMCDANMFRPIIIHNINYNTANCTISEDGDRC